MAKLYGIGNNTQKQRKVELSFGKINHKKMCSAFQQKNFI